LDKIQAKNELTKAVHDGELLVRHSGTHGPFPESLKLEQAVVLVPAVVAYLADYGIEVRIESGASQYQPIDRATRPSTEADIESDGATVQEKRQAERWQAVEDAGLTPPANGYEHMPRGSKAVALKLGISRQALAQDVKAHADRLASKQGK
jgi:NAD/NADP transhydrogenase alpha subunit